MPPAFDITIQIHSSRWKTMLRPYCKTVRQAVEAALQQMPDDRCQMTEITVVLVDDEFMRTLNRQYRGKDKATNVLSFPARHPVGGAAAAQDPAQSLRASQDDGHLGDLVLALETIEREATEQGKKFKDHVTHLLVHGTLHLLGHDHEKDKEAQRMEKLEIKILKALGIGNPYR